MKMMVMASMVVIIIMVILVMMMMMMMVMMVVMMTMVMTNEMYLGVVQDTPVFVLVAFVISTCNQCGEGKEAYNVRAM